MTTLDGKIVFITGASSGIGAALARELVARGARPGLVARRRDRLRELAGELRGRSGSAPGSGERTVAWAVADVTDGEQLAAAFEGLRGELGGVDVMVANAGYARPEPPHKLRPGRSLDMYDTNLFGMLRAIDWVLPRFLERRSGHIVGISSVASFLGMPNTASYCGSKAAMRIHLQALRVSLRRYGVAVTTVCPGFIKTELTARNRFKMPFLWETGRAARKIADAIEQRRGEVVFPWQMRLLAGVLAGCAPTGLLERLLVRTQPAPRTPEQET